MSYSTALAKRIALKLSTEGTDNIVGEKACASIEALLQGTTNYYRSLLKEAREMNTSKTPLDSIVSLELVLRKALAPFRNFSPP